MERVNRAEQIKKALRHALLIFLFSAGMLSGIVPLLGIEWSMLPMLLYCVVFSAALAIVYHVRIRFKPVWLLLILAGLGVWGAMGGGPVFALVQSAKAAFLCLRGLNGWYPYLHQLRLTLCFAVCLVSCVTCMPDSDAGAYIYLVWMLMLICALIGQGISLPLGLILFTCAGFLVELPQSSGRLLSLCAVSAVLLAAGFLLYRTATLPKVEPAEKAAQDIRNLADDYLFFNEYRESFSLESEGMMELSSRLGGSANIPEGSVMHLTADTDGVVYLRGKTYDTYNGLNWFDSLSSKRFLYASPRLTAQRNELFDLTRPMDGAETFPVTTAQITMLCPMTTTFFAPQFSRSFQLTGERMVLYYNLSGELFLTRSLEPGDTYSVSFLNIPHDSVAAQTLAQQCADLNDPHYAAVCASYLALPDHIQQEVRDIALDMTRNAKTP